MKRTFPAAFAALALAVLTACESPSTRMKGVWVSPYGTRTPFGSVLVIGVNGDATARRLYEDAVVEQLAGRGIKARVSYDLLPELGPVPPPAVEKVVRAGGLDAVLISRAVRSRAEIRVTPGNPHGGPWGGMWHGAWSVPPNVYTTENVDVESQLFDARVFVPVWTGLSTTQPSASMQQTIGDFAKLLVKALAGAKVIA